MSNKSNEGYFQIYVEHAEVAVAASEYLCQCLKTFRPEDIATMLVEMHEYEHKGDDLRHKMAAMLAKAFVTPLEREDMAELSQNIDSVVDSIEEVLQYVYMDCVETVFEDAVTFATKVNECCVLMKELLEEMPTFRKSSKIHEMVIKINHAEEECDRLFLNANYRFRKNLDVSDGKAALSMVTWREIYGALESCADATEKVADTVEAIVMKNT
ncbi:MAG: DUF47 family protein [Clostridiales bacterium]|nr:DUF47 family protein [Candidatus Scatonaster coprocaballi]